ncbi:hypothetical protein COV82_03250 [Candidatus Peregrinibacteria bacterium CG11_big_fil_rev_8_21_14_0_20_46_8]|nr:MAG: hypothetical protein COV82_03250 [Candidatus Peregrinibacteria bacterium CG11_big_fil_rev_8_21_14_0_20_46_8]
MHKLIYAKKALQDLKKLDKPIAKRIIKKLLFFSEQKDPLKFAKRLSDPRIGEYRFRIGEYRVLFDADSKGKIKILMILRIKNRKDIYDL